MSKSKRKAPELIRRQRALAYLIAKYKGRACDFVGADCIRMSRTHLIKMGRTAPALPRYRSLAGALRALKDAGFENLTELFDSLLERIPAAAMLPGDLAVMTDGEGIGAAVVNIGNGKVLGWHQDAPEIVIIVAHRIDAAWRV
ncbi:MAG TPA: hypothetical protein VGB54_11265 [Allosphingosinicella sp.]|jgi:hypothetical protein